MIYRISKYEDTFSLTRDLLEEIKRDGQLRVTNPRNESRTYSFSDLELIEGKRVKLRTGIIVHVFPFAREEKKFTPKIRVRKAG